VITRRERARAIRRRIRHSTGRRRMGRREQARARARARVRARARRAARRGRAVNYIDCNIKDVDDIDCYLNIDDIDDWQVNRRRRYRRARRTVCRAGRIYRRASRRTAARCATDRRAEAAVLAAREPFGEHAGWDAVSDAVAVVVPAALLDVGRAAVPLC